MSALYDLAIIGGGILGSAAACRAAEGGMRTIVIEQQTLGSGASGVNAGTLSLQIKRVKLMPYAIKGHELWERAGERVGFHKTGGITLAFNQREADLLNERMALKREAGAPIELISPARVAELEPNLSRKVVAASWCAEDGYANASLSGAYYRALLEAAGVEIRERTPVTAIERGGGAFQLATPAGEIRATRLLLACGARLRRAGDDRPRPACPGPRQHRLGHRARPGAGRHGDRPCHRPAHAEAKAERQRPDRRRLAGQRLAG